MLPEQQQSWLQSEVNSEEFTCAQKGVDGVHSHGREMLCVLSPTVVSMALRGQAIHPVTTLSLPQIVPSYCGNKPELDQPENERPHGDNATDSRLFVMA